MSIAKEIQQLAAAGRFDLAAQKLASIDHPASRGFAAEQAGDGLSLTAVGPALWAYEQARNAYADYASGATSGGEGTARMRDVRRMEKRIAFVAANPTLSPALAEARVRSGSTEFGLEDIGDLRKKLDALRKAGELPADLLASGLDFLASHTSSPLSGLLAAFFKEVGPRHEGYEKAVLKHFTQENFTRLCENYPVERGDLPKPRSWEEWERAWPASQEDWPLAELVFALNLPDKINFVLSRPRGGLAPSEDTIQYFLLRRLAEHPEPDVDRCHALTGLVSACSSEHRRLVRDRAALVFREHWNASATGLEPFAASVQKWMEAKRREFPE